MAKLYEIAQRYKNVQDLAFNEEIDPILVEDALWVVDDEFSEKVLNIVKIVKNLKGYMAMVEDEDKRLQNKKKVLKNKVDSLEEYLKHCLVSAGFSKYDLGIFTVSLRKSEKVEIDSLLDVPDEFLKFLNPEPKKSEIKKAIKNGLKVKGARLVENESLQIR